MHTNGPVPSYVDPLQRISAAGRDGDQEAGFRKPAEKADLTGRRIAQRRAIPCKAKRNQCVRRNFLRALADRLEQGVVKVDEGDYRNLASPKNSTRAPSAAIKAGSMLPGGVSWQISDNRPSAASALYRKFGMAVP